jgi:ABC-2 type transport system ATP-binding protein
MLYRNLSGLENLEYSASLAGKRRYTRAELQELLIHVGIASETGRRRVSTYSKGIRPKVGIGTALAKEAKALLLYEPTSGLDPKASNEFSELIGRLSGSGVATLIAAHDLFRAKESGTRVGIMKHGRLNATLRTDQIGHADLERLYLQHMHD